MNKSTAWIGSTLDSFRADLTQRPSLRVFLQFIHMTNFRYFIGFFLFHFCARQTSDRRTQAERLGWCFVASSASTCIDSAGHSVWKDLIALVSKTTFWRLAVLLCDLTLHAKWPYSFVSSSLRAFLSCCPATIGASCTRLAWHVGSLSVQLSGMIFGRRNSGLVSKRFCIGRVIKHGQCSKCPFFLWFWKLHLLSHDHVPFASSICIFFHFEFCDAEKRLFAINGCPWFCALHCKGNPWALVIDGRYKIKQLCTLCGRSAAEIARRECLFGRLFFSE